MTTDGTLETTPKKTLRTVRHIRLGDEVYLLAQQKAEDDGRTIGKVIEMCITAQLGRDANEQ